mgnify:FL=1
MNDKMTDAELSKKLGRYQAAESIGILLGALCVIAGCVLAFVLHDLVVVLILGFSGVALLLLIALPAQKKKNALIWQQLGGYFGAELKRFFGEEPEKPELPIDDRFLKNVGMIGIEWTGCSVKDFHEGEHNGLRFSAANVELSRTVEERSGPDNDNWMTRSETLFRGVVLRCRDICAPGVDITLNEQFQERKGGDLTDPAVFRKHFAARNADGQPADELVTPQLRALVRRLEEFANNGKVGGLILRGGELTLALNTGYVFANVPNAIDMRDIDGIRKWFTASLNGMAGLLDILRESPALTDTVSQA